MQSWDNLTTPAEKQRMQTYKQQNTKQHTTPSIRILTELGTLYGWQAIHDTLTNQIDPTLMLNLIKEGHHQHQLHLAEQYQLTYECITAAFSKHGDQKINQIINELRKE